MSSREDAEEALDISRRLAALAIWRQCNQHQCTAASRMPAKCEHPNHRRDVDYLKHCLDALGLSGPFPVVTDNDRSNLIAALEKVGPIDIVDTLP